MTYLPEVTIIGGGIIGLLTAQEFVKKGCQVTIIDKRLSGQESSWAGGGILLPLYPWKQPCAISTLVVESIKTYRDLSRELYGATQIDPEWYDCGLLICKNEDIQLATQWCSKNDIPYEEVDNAFCSDLKTTPVSPLWMPTIAQARNPRLLKALKAYLCDKGVSFIENCELTACDIKDGAVCTLSTTRGKFDIDQLIIGAGAWTGQLMQKLLPDNQNLPDISPVKGQMILFDAKPDTLPYMVLDGDHYLIPRRDGKILVGSSVEYSAFDKSTSNEVKESLYLFATEILPALKQFNVSRHWAGLRPGTKLGIPYISKHPEIKNLSINAGHFRNGLVMGPASSKLMVDLVLGRPTSIDPEPYRL